MASREPFAHNFKLSNEESHSDALASRSAQVKGIGESAHFGFLSKTDLILPDQKVGNHSAKCLAVIIL